MQFRVAIIVGDNHTPYCGVKNYARALAAALAKVDIDADVLAPMDWGAHSFAQFRRQLRGYDILHVQYPAIGYRASLFPHLLGLLRAAKASVVTLHEYSALPLPQKLSTHLFRCTAGVSVFPGEYERSRYNRYLSAFGATQVIVPIGSNVPRAPIAKSRNSTVVYFGQIRPDKGVEAFLELAKRSILSKRQFHFQIIGSALRAHQAYMASLRSGAPDAIEWSIDLGFTQVAEILAKSFAAYLPFPDGVSERRSSMLAALANGLPVLSTIGPATPAQMLPIFLPAKDCEGALSGLDELSSDPERCERMSVASRSYAAKYAWSEIAAQHALVYRKALQCSGGHDADLFRTTLDATSCIDKSTS